MPRPVFNRCLHSARTLLLGLFLTSSAVFAAEGDASVADKAAPEEDAATRRRTAEQAVKLPPGFRYEILVQGGIPEPVYLQFCPDGRLWFTGRRGEIWAYDFQSKAHALVTTLPVDWQQVPGKESNERGLHGIEFHPDYLKNGQVFLYYAPVYGNGIYSNRVARFTVNDPKRATGLKKGSEKVLLEFVSLRGFHQGGAMEYNPRDGKLYVTMGDNNVSKDTKEFWNDPRNPALRLDMYQGKVLRLNLDGSVPTDNPFVKTPDAAPQVFSYGHRNPYSLHIDETTGRVYVGEVGYDRQEDWEEINLIKAGGNFGWPRLMGKNLPVFPTEESNPYPDAILPWITYGHGGGANATVGPIYHGKGPGAFPKEYEGGMFYGDFTQKWVRFAKIDPATHTVTNTVQFARGFSGGPLQMQLGPDGAVYLAEYAGWFGGTPKDAISRIVYVGTEKP
jgi:glucose/arabinose dehydrogenase